MITVLAAILQDYDESRERCGHIGYFTNNLKYNCSNEKLIYPQTKLQWTSVGLI